MIQSGEKHSQYLHNPYILNIVALHNYTNPQYTHAHTQKERAIILKKEKILEQGRYNVIWGFRK